MALEYGDWWTVPKGRLLGAPTLGYSLCSLECQVLKQQWPLCFLVLTTTGEIKKKYFPDIMLRINCLSLLNGNLGKRNFSNHYDLVMTIPLPFSLTSPRSPQFVLERLGCHSQLLGEAFLLPSADLMCFGRTKHKFLPVVKRSPGGVWEIRTVLLPLPLTATQDRLQGRDSHQELGSARCSLWCTHWGHWGQPAEAGIAPRPVTCTTAWQSRLFLHAPSSSSSLRQLHKALWTAGALCQVFS